MEVDDSASEAAESSDSDFNPAHPAGHLHKDKDNGILPGDNTSNTKAHRKQRT
jgi:hypothetical protein